LGAYVIRVPQDGWAPEGWTPPAADDSTSGMRTTANVSAANAIKTPQFWLLWTALFCNVTAGIGILNQASPMAQDFFAGIGPAAAAGYVGLLSLANMAGRIVWSSTSDYIGRKPTYMMYLGVGAVLYLLVALFGTASMLVFVLLTAVIISYYGGGFATVPAYLKDIFGEYQVGAIHGRLLTAWAAAGVAGPLIVSGVLDLQTSRGAEGAALYELSLYIMVGILVLGFLANLLVRPVNDRFHEPEADDTAADEDEPQEASDAGTEHGPEDGASGAERTAAILLWILVGAGLVYGIVETALNATALFG
ncbi:MFS transporter, partial [Georgenia sp. 10Sc9-8]|nr:MFS transporter [Georgenia halotolerans]